VFAGAGVLAPPCRRIGGSPGFLGFGVFAVTIAGTSSATAFRFRGGRL
jgi:hypothetical protein